MKFLKAGIFFSLLFAQCFGMEPLFIVNPKVAEILTQLQAKDTAQTLQPEEFWKLMESSTDMGSCFLGESLAQINEEDACLILRYLIVFGQSDKNKFYVCMTSCLGVDGITPLNELIRRIQSVNSEIYRLFLQLLDLIKTLDETPRVAIVTQKDMYGTAPILTAQKENKPYITNPLADIIFNSAGPAQWAGSDDGRFVAVEGDDSYHPEMYKWDGTKFYPI